METFGAKLRAVRKEANKLLTDVADVWEISVPHASDIERDKRNAPTLDAIFALLQSWGMEHHYEELAELATKQRNGEIRMRPRTGRMNEVLTQLCREDVSDQTLRLVLKMLRDARNGGQ